MEVVQVLVDEHTAEKNSDRNLADFNNDRTTRFDDVKTLLADAQKDIADPDWLKAHGFSAQMP